MMDWKPHIHVATIGVSILGIWQGLLIQSTCLTCSTRDIIGMGLVGVRMAHLIVTARLDAWPLQAEQGLFQLYPWFQEHYRVHGESRKTRLTFASLLVQLMCRTLLTKGTGFSRRGRHRGVCCVEWYLSGKEIDCSQSSTSSAPTTYNTVCPITYICLWYRIE